MVKKVLLVAILIILAGVIFYLTMKKEFNNIEWVYKLEKKEKNILWYGIGVLILIGGLTMVVRTKK